MRRGEGDGRIGLAPPVMPWRPWIKPLLVICTPELVWLSMPSLLKSVVRVDSIVARIRLRNGLDRPSDWPDHGIGARANRVSRIGLDHAAREINWCCTVVPEARRSKSIALAPPGEALSEVMETVVIDRPVGTGARRREWHRRGGGLNERPRCCS